MSSAAVKPQEWTRDGYIISTDDSLVSLSGLNKALGSDQIYWTTSLPEAQLKLMVESSVCFGVYSPTSRLPPETSETDIPSARNQDAATTLHEVAERVHHLQPQGGQQQKPPSTPGEPSMIGFARLVTDNVSVAYLTDVYILPEWQKQGLGTWLLDCVKEYVERMPMLRMFLLITSEGPKENYYAKKLGTSRLEVDTPGHRFFMKRGPGSKLSS